MNTYIKHGAKTYQVELQIANSVSSDKTLLQVKFAVGEEWKVAVAEIGPAAPQSEIRSCHNCQHFSICRLRAAVDKGIHDNLGMVDVDQRPCQWTLVFEPLARACLEYKEQPKP